MANADTLARSGIPYPLATELARQMTAGAGNGNANALMALGMHTTAAVEVARQINAASFDGHKLATAMVPTAVADLLKKHSGL